MANELITVKDTVRDSLLMFPGIFKNALDVYNHLFCTIGNGYEWHDGCLIYSGYTPGDEITIHTIKDAVLKVVERNKNNHNHHIGELAIIESGIEAGKVVSEKQLDVLEKCVVKRIANREGRVLSDIELCYRIDERCDDFSIPSESGKYEDRLYNTPDYKWRIYPICNYSEICNIPDDVQEDWLEACKFMLEFIKNNPEYTNDGDAKWVPVIEQRIAELSGR